MEINYYIFRIVIFLNSLSSIQKTTGNQYSLVLVNRFPVSYNGFRILIQICWRNNYFKTVSFFSRRSETLILKAVLSAVQYHWYKPFWCYTQFSCHSLYNLIHILLWSLVTVSKWLICYIGAILCKISATTEYTCASWFLSCAAVVSFASLQTSIRLDEHAGNTHARTRKPDANVRRWYEFQKWLGVKCVWVLCAVADVHNACMSPLHTKGSGIGDQMVWWMSMLMCLLVKMTLHTSQCSVIIAFR